MVDTEVAPEEAALVFVDATVDCDVAEERLADA
jgi:hypothetical protein